MKAIQPGHLLDGFQAAVETYPGNATAQRNFLVGWVVSSVLEPQDHADLTAAVAIGSALRGLGIDMDYAERKALVAA